MIGAFILVLIAQTHQVRYYRRVTGQLTKAGVVRAVKAVYDDATPIFRGERDERQLCQP
jgi:hypothetical protein